MMAVQGAEETSKEIDIAREEYRPVAFHAALLFFCVADMASVDPMYQYSLQWYIALYERAIDEAEVRLLADPCYFPLFIPFYHFKQSNKFTII